MAAVVAILDLLLEMILAIFINKSLRYFLSSFESIGLLVKEKDFEIDFHSWISIGTILV